MFSNEKQFHIQPISIMLIWIKTHKTQWVQKPESEILLLANQPLRFYLAEQSTKIKSKNGDI